MKAAKWLLLLPAVVFPYGFWFLVNRPGGDIWTEIGWLWLAGLVGELLLFYFGHKEKWSAHAIAMASMAVKLVQIPAYLMWFLVGVALFIFLGPVLAFTIDAMTIALSGLVGLAAVLRCKREGILTVKQAVIYGVLQFVFCADVVSAIILYRKTKGADQ